MLRRDTSILIYILLLLPHLLLTDNESHHPVSRGRCVIAQGQQHQLTASSARMCAFLCSQLLNPCISWSYRTGICNVSDSVQTHLMNHTDCEMWSALHQLSLVAFWPMSNATRTRNVASDSGYLDLHENQVMQYTDDAVNFTGQFDVNERYNIDQLASHCLNSFTFSVWVKVTNPSRGPMPLLEGQTMSTGYTRLWLYPAATNIEFTIQSPYARGAFDDPLVSPNVWTQITAIYDKETPDVKIYLNATRILTTSVTPGTVTSCVKFGTKVQIGAIIRGPSHNRVFQGYMKCFGVSERALGYKDIIQLSQMCQQEGSP